MAEPLTIYECATGACNHLSLTPGMCLCRDIKGSRVTYRDARAMRVFREEDVRPLHRALERMLEGGVMFGAKDGVRMSDVPRDALAAFPAPAEWSGDAA
jgi:hypothetical protein